MCLHRAIVYYVKKLTIYIYIYIYVKGISAKLPLFDWLRNRRYKKGRDRQYRELEGAHGILLGPFVGELGGSPSHNKATTSVGDRSDQGGVLRM